MEGDIWYFGIRTFDSSLILNKHLQKTQWQLKLKRIVEKTRHLKHISCGWTSKPENVLQQLKNFSIHNFTKFTPHWKTVTSFVQLTEKSHTTGNPIVRWLNRLQIYGRDKVSRVTSGREGAGTKRCSVQRTFVRVKLFLCILFTFSIRCC